MNELMRYFVREETGCTSMLCSAFGVPGGTDNNQNFCSEFSRILESCGVRLESPTPVQVIQEAMGFLDAVIVWDDWNIIVESKIDSSSVTKGQLTRYYKYALNAMITGAFLDDDQNATRNVLMIYLTPTQQSGRAEFDSLALLDDRSDRKIHVAWPTVLSAIRNAYGGLEDPESAMIMSGANLTAGLLKSREKAGVDFDDTRQAAVALADLVRSRVVDALQHEEICYIKTWHDKDHVQLYGCLGGNASLVTMYIDLKRSRLVSTPMSATVRIFFNVAAKFRSQLGDSFNQIAIDHWADLLCVDGDLLVDDPGRFAISYERVFEGENQDALARQLAPLFSRFLLVFRRFMPVPVSD